MSEIGSESRAILFAPATEIFDEATIKRTKDWIKLTYNRLSRKPIRNVYFTFGPRWQSNRILGNLFILVKRDATVDIAIKLIAGHILWWFENRKRPFDTLDHLPTVILGYDGIKFVFGEELARKRMNYVPEFETMSIEESENGHFANLTLAIFAKCGILRELRLESLKSDYCRLVQLAGNTTISYEELPDLLDEVCDFLDEMFED